MNATAAFEADAAGSGYVDFSSSDRYQLQVEEYLADTTTFVAVEASTLKPVSSARAKYTDLFSSTYTIPAGHYVVVKLVLSSASGHTITAWNIDLRVEVIKR